MIIEYTNETNFDEIVKGNVIVDFWAPWCGPCKQLAPVLEIVSNETNITILKIDTDEYPDITSQYGIRSLPTLKYFKDGKEIMSSVGFSGKTTILDNIKKVY